MLFDTSSPGRKRAVQVIFAFLAILMGGGLVLFGIGSSQSGGGLTDIVNNGGVTNSADQGKKDAESAEKALAANPKDVAAAEKLAKARLLIATTEAFDASGNVIDEKAQALVTAADSAWTKYLALAPAKPSGTVSAGYAAFYAYPGVSQYDKAARALETNLVTREPSAGLYAQLSIYYLASGNNDKAKDAKEQALKAATSETRRTAISKELGEIEASIKKQQEAIAKQTEAAGSTPDSTTPKLPTLPTLQ